MRRTRTERALRPWLVGLGLSSSLAFASPLASAEPSAGRAEARAHFDQGIVLARRRAYAEALAEFQRAYEIAPHFSVLYNIGQALIALDRPTEAVAALDRYLEEGGSELDSHRRAEVGAAIESELAKTGGIEVTVDLPGALVTIDDKPYGRSPLPAPIRVDGGTHHVLATLESGERREANVETQAKQLSHAQLVFAVEAPSVPVTAPPHGSLRIRCAEPGLSVIVDSQPLGVTPLSSPLTLAPGNHRLRFARGSLEGAEQQVNLLAQAELELTCAVPAPAPPAPLAPPPSSSEPRSSAVHHSTQKTLAYVVGAAGVALTGAAAAHFLWNRARYQDWQSRYTTYFRDPTEQNRDSANSLAQSISNASPVTLGLAVAAGVAFGTSAVLLLTSSDSVTASGGARGGGPFIALQGAF